MQHAQMQGDGMIMCGVPAVFHETSDMACNGG